MRVILGLFPFLALIILFLFILGALKCKQVNLTQQSADGNPQIAIAFAIAVVIWGCYLSIFSELLSFFSSINLISLMLAWGIPTLVLLFIGLREKKFQYGWSLIIERFNFNKLTCLEYAIVALMAI
jgi:hypothetical protein